MKKQLYNWFIISSNVQAICQFLVGDEPDVAGGWACSKREVERGRHLFSLPANPLSPLL